MSPYPEEFRKDAVALYRAAAGKRTYAAVAARCPLPGINLKAAITSHRDMRVLAALLEHEEDERRRLLESVGYAPDAD